MDSAFAYLRNKSHRNSLILIGVLLLGLIVGLILIRNPQIFNPRAATQNVEVELGDNVKVIDNEKVVVPPVNYQQGATIPIKIKLTTPFDGSTTAPSEPTANVNCANGAKASITWTGSPGKGAEADTANKGKTGFYVDISTAQNFDPTYNKFVETNQSTGSTSAPEGFVLANAGSTNPPTGSPLSLTSGTTYYARVFNGAHSSVKSFVASCNNGGGDTSSAESVLSNWGKTVPQGTLGDLSNNGVVDSLDFERAFKGNAVQSFLNNLIPTVNAQTTPIAICGETITVDTMKDRLRQSSYNGSYDDMNAMQAAYKNARCPIGDLPTPVTTCKSPLGGPKNIEELMRDLRDPRTNFPDPGFTRTNLQQAIAAYNEAQVECRSTQGFLDDQYNDCQVRGWAAKANPNSAPTSVEVKIYKGNKTELLGTVKADKPRSDLKTAIPWLRNSVNHGFEFTLPANLKGTTTPVYAFAVDPTNASNEVALQTNGRNITCAAGPATPPPTPPSTPPAPPTATPTNLVGYYKLIESDGGKVVYEDTDWKPMTTSPLTIDHGISGNTGEKTLTVIFKSVDGRTETRSTKIKVISIAPEITNLTCNLDAASNGIIFEAKGKSFHKDSKIFIKEQNNNRMLDITGNTTSSLIRGVLKNVSATIEFSVGVINPDNRISNIVKCQSGSKAFQLRSNVFCQQIWPFDVDDVEMTFIDRGAGGSKVTEKVVIGKDGMVKNIKSRLQPGRNYAIAIKAPKSLRRVVNFTASEGTDVIDSLMLPVGDIWGPGGRPDGVINTNDRGRFNEDWRVLTDSPDIRLSDFNRDKRVNSFDWACMRQGFNESDDPIPGAGATAEYKFDPAAPNAGQKVRLTVDKVSLAPTTYDYIALRVKPKGSQPEKYLWFNKQTLSTQGPPFFWESDDERNTKLLGEEAKFYDLSTNGEYTFQMVAHCKYPADEDAAFPDCSEADIFFNEVTLTIGQLAAPSAPTVQTSCTNNNPVSTFSWTGTAGKGADADTANKGKTGFYVDISTTSNFELVNNKFIPGNTTTTDSTGFVLANAGRSDTGSPFVLKAGTKYYARVFNGKHSTTAEFTPTCTPPVAVTVKMSCPSGNPVAAINWTGNPGQGAEADTANKGKSGFYVDISPAQNFDTVYNKFVETNQTIGSTTAPGGFVLANAGRADTGSPLTLTTGSNYFVRVYNGTHSAVQPFTATCIADI